MPSILGLRTSLIGIGEVQAEGGSDLGFSSCYTQGRVLGSEESLWERSAGHVLVGINSPIVRGTPKDTQRF